MLETREKGIEKPEDEKKDGRETFVFVLGGSGL